MDTAVVTGASSGIGAATARRLAAAGYRVVLAARRAERLRDLAEEVGGLAVPVDLTDPRSVRRLADQVDAASVLVNNAGGAIGLESVAEARVADWAAMYEVNVLGAVRVTQTLLPVLRRAAHATIVFVTSTAAQVVYEGGGGYCAAKHAEHALAATLRLELNGEPIRVVEVAPGMVHTEEFSLNRFRGDRTMAEAVYAGVDEPLTADDVAACVAWAVTAPPHVNLDLLTVRPLAQAAQHKVHRRG
ncbi:MAG: SDR family NAD(P)-dependent oxidoreductase [Actinomycetales bacterium]|nr:SDR family NAD(P)-dependent oxidoreductase [Actinomycetales bacterium]